MTIDSLKDEFNNVINSDSVPEYIKTLFSTCIEQDISNPEIWRFLYDIKDNISSDLSDEFVYYLKNNASLQWFMILITIYEEKIEDTTKYFDLVKKGYNAGLDVIFIDKCQKNTFSYLECEKLIMEEINKNEDISEEIESENDLEEKSLNKVTLDITPEDVENVEITHLKSVNSSLKKMLDDNMSELEQLQTELFTMKKEMFSYKNDITSYESKVNNLTKENKDLSLNKRMIEKRLNNIQKQCNILKNINAELSEATEEIDKDKYSGLEKRINELEKENADVVTDKKEIERKYQKLYVEHMELTSKYNDLKESNDTGMSFEHVDAPSEHDISFYNDEIDESNESIYMNIEDIEASTDNDIDYNEADVISMIPDAKTKAEIKEHRSIFVKLINKFRDREFIHMPFHEQQGKIFTRMMKLDFPKDTIKLVSSTLNSNKDKVSLELYHMVERNATPEECEMYCKSFNAA